jgi:peptidoglycan/LPS O-acetylase OafA/YrhL
LNDPVESAGTALWQRLRSRRIVQWGLGYVAVAWGLLQATGFAVETFHWPEVVTRTAVIAAVAGLPIALTIAWFHGKRGEQSVRRLELVILALLVAAGLFAVYRELTEVQPPAWAMRPMVPCLPSALPRPCCTSSPTCASSR